MADEDTRAQAPATLVPYRMTICGLDELPEHVEAGVTHVLSILDPHAPVPGALDAFEALRQHWVLRFHDIATPAPMMDAPGHADVEELLGIGRELDAAGPGGHVLVHCHAGVSRSTAAAAILLARNNAGREAEAFRTVGRLRPGAWPNARMVELADRQLDRAGRLVHGLQEMQARRMGGGPAMGRWGR